MKETVLRHPREAYTVSSCPDVKLTTDRFSRSPLMTVNRRLLKERLNLNPGLIAKTKLEGHRHLKLF
jgi:hypothetical protein